jgi:hypothetical protein
VTTEFFDALPEDNFGVHVTNDMDVKKLLWLVNEIGEKKLRISSAKYKLKYPESSVYISTVLRWHGLKVPYKIYAPVVVPIYSVYVLLLSDHSTLKIGFTGRWPMRSYDFLKTANYRKFIPFEKLDEFFDLERSYAVFFNSESAARDVEATTLVKFAEFRAPSPRDRGLISYGCAGHTEWFEVSIYEQLTDYLFGLDLVESKNSQAVSQTLESALLYEQSLFLSTDLIAN